jgi:hypothetical protein
VIFFSPARYIVKRVERDKTKVKTDRYWDEGELSPRGEQVDGERPERLAGVAPAGSVNREITIEYDTEP